MTNPQRLDHVEDELETVKQLLVSTASYAESANRRIDQSTIKQDNTQEQKFQFQEFRLTTGAALERIDRVLDYLLRQQGGNQDTPV